MKKIGFDTVYDCSLGNDIQIMEMAKELIEHIKREQEITCYKQLLSFLGEICRTVLSRNSTTSANCKSAQQI